LVHSSLVEGRTMFWAILTHYVRNSINAIVELFGSNLYEILGSRILGKILMEIQLVIKTTLVKINSKQLRVTTVN